MTSIIPSTTAFAYDGTLRLHGGDQLAIGGVLDGDGVGRRAVGVTLSVRRGLLDACHACSSVPLKGSAPNLAFGCVRRGRVRSTRSSEDRAADPGSPSERPRSRPPHPSPP